MKIEDIERFLEILGQNFQFIPRNEVEGNPRLKQIIPYCILYHKDNKGFPMEMKNGVVVRFFHAQRKPEADRELQEKWTIGLGGHINPQDSSYYHQLLQKYKNKRGGRISKRIFCHFP